MGRNRPPGACEAPEGPCEALAANVQAITSLWARWPRRRDLRRSEAVSRPCENPPFGHFASGSRSPPGRLEIAFRHAEAWVAVSAVEWVRDSADNHVH